MKNESSRGLIDWREFKKRVSDWHYCVDGISKEGQTTLEPRSAGTLDLRSMQTLLFSSSSCVVFVVVPAVVAVIIPMMVVAVVVCIFFIGDDVADSAGDDKGDKCDGGVGIVDAPNTMGDTGADAGADAGEE